MEFKAGDDKKEIKQRGLSFEQIEAAPVLDFIPNPNRKGQMLLIVEIENYAVVVPCKDEGDDVWLMVTAWKCRKSTRKYLRK